MSADVGRVRSWHPQDGWGVIDADATPGGCWVHVSALRVGPPRTLAVGQEVEFAWERADQDGYAFRATAAWPRGTTPTEPPPVTGPGPAYRSEVTIELDQP